MSMTYPDTRIDDAEDTLCGVSFPDPYRWLEADSGDVRQWQRAQAQLASAHVREWPHFEQLHQLVARLSIDQDVELPRHAGGRWFRTRVVEGASQAQALVADEATGEGRVLFDPVTENRERPPCLSWIAPSPDGSTLAMGLCADGSEKNTIRLIDVDTGLALADPPSQVLMDNWTGGAQWLPDSSGFFFTALFGAAHDFDQQIFLHRRLPAPTTVPVDIARTRAKDYRVVVISRDGRYAVALERLTNPIPVAIAAIGNATLRWQPFVTSIGGTVAGHMVGDRYVAVTDVGAPRGRLVAIPLDARDPNDPANWHELLAESNATLRAVTPVGDVLYLTELVDTYARVRIVNLNGKLLGEVPLPGQGAIAERLPFPMVNLIPQGHPEMFLFAFSSFTVGWGIYSHTPGENRIRALQESKVRLNNAVVEDRCAISADGTRVPYHIVRRAEVGADQPQPTLIYAYGGWNVPNAPLWHSPHSVAAFIALGGVYVHAHLRGGGEFGLNWWQGGRLANKQNCYNDLYAIAEDLIATKRCTPQSLALMGGSNGGLMAGVAVTQRPDLWKVVLPRVPILDLIGACRDPYGRTSVTMEYGNIENPEGVRQLATRSPYQLVRDGINYPAVFIDAGDTDPRGAPWHARKFAARLQRATSGSAPILLHVWENAGHGMATDKSIALTQNAEWLAFTLRHLGVEWPRLKDYAK
jgi:prolyl oligopeptidase